MLDTAFVARHRGQLPRLAGNVTGRNVLAAVACFAAGAAAHMASVGHSQPLVWPALGVGLALAVLWGMDLWPGLFVGFLAANWAAGTPAVAAAAGAAANTVGVLGGRFVLRRLPRFNVMLERVEDLLGLIYGGALGASILSATVHVAVLRALGRLDGVSLFEAWWTRWLTGCLGVLVVTPWLLTWSEGTWRPRDRAWRREAASLLALLLAAGLVVFGGSYSTQLAAYSVPYVVFIFSLWSALRFGPRGAAVTVFLVALISLWGTARRHGPFVVENTLDIVLLWSVFNGVFAVSTLVLAAVIAERRNSEDALQASEARYRHLFSHAPISIWEEDFSGLLEWLQSLRAQGVINLEDHLERHPELLDQALDLVTVRDINNVTLAMFQADQRDQVLGPLSKTIRGETRQYFLGELLTIWNGQRRYENEITARTLKGRRIDYLVHWDATTESGQTDWSHVIVAIMDITERSRLRDEVRQVQKMEAVGRLAGGIAHDFNNLIMTIQGYCSLLKGDLGGNPVPRDELEQIKKAAERGAALTRQLLAFSRKQVLKPRVFDLNVVVSDMNKMLRRLISEDIQLQHRLDPEPCWVRADRGQLEQVIVNLAVNARDAMPRGGRLIIETAHLELHHPATLVLTGHLAPGRYVSLAVTDTGFGIAPEVKSHLFEPFFTTKDPGAGTGLGLSMVYGIIKQSGGEIEVTSEADRGSTFRIYLPLVEPPHPGEEPVPKTCPPARGSETILLAEDEPGVRELLARCLRTHGYLVLEAACGAEALRLAEQTDRLDLLFTDVVMPGMNGQELAQTLLERQPDLKVIFYSGYVDNAPLRQRLAQMGSAFLEKPFPLDALLRTVRETLDAPASPAPVLEGEPQRPR